MSRVNPKNLLYSSAWRSRVSFIQKFPCLLVAVLIATQLTLLTTQPAQALSLERSFANPPQLDFHEFLGDTIETQAAEAESEARTGIDRSNQKEFDLKIKCNPGQLYNPLTNRKDEVNLRSYVGTGIAPNTPYVAPTIEVTPGDTIRVNLDNQLNDGERCVDVPESVVLPPHFNSTNLHSHGLWINPAGNGDNVLISIEPGVKFQYEYNLPPEHPAGTFWYHPHRHESTASHVSSGMVGALIVRGDRLPSATKNGDIDTLLKRFGSQPIPEKILVFQQIQYACLNDKGEIKKEGETWVCEPEDTGNIESNLNFGFGENWAKSGRYTSINGQILPTFSAQAGMVERWRMIHAGVRDTIHTEFRKLATGAPEIDTLSPDEVKTYSQTYCTGSPIDYHIIANDGLTRRQAWQTQRETLQPGYRSDALMIFPEAGEYCMVDAQAPAAANVSKEDSEDQLLGFVDVAAGFPIPPEQIHRHLIQKLQRKARLMLSVPKAVRAEIVEDLQDLKFTKFIPHADITENEVEGNQQELAFNIQNGKFQVSNCLEETDECKFQSYEHDRIDRKLILDTADEWTLTSKFGGHPFHIHVNPFQVVKILDPNGHDVSLPGASDGNDPEYPGLQGVWKDTLWIKQDYTIVVRTRYERYIGQFVLHCHILEHEDQGMMQNVEIVLPE